MTAAKPKIGGSGRIALLIVLCVLGAVWPMKRLIEWGAAGPNDFMYFWEAGQAALGAPASRRQQPLALRAQRVVYPSGQVHGPQHVAEPA